MEMSTKNVVLWPLKMYVNELQFDNTIYINMES